MALAFNGRGGGGSSTPFNGGTIHAPLEIHLPSTAAGHALRAAIDGLAQWGINLELTDNGGGVVDADVSITGQSATGKGTLLLATGDASSQTRVGTDIITMDSASNVGTDTLLQVTSAFWGTLFTVFAGSLQAGAPMMFRRAPVLQVNAAPAAASLAAGDCALWFDQTVGAAKLMVEAKNANGTVVTGSLALA